MIYKYRNAIGLTVMIALIGLSGYVGAYLVAFLDELYIIHSEGLKWLILYGSAILIFFVVGSLIFKGYDLLINKPYHNSDNK